MVENYKFDLILSEGESGGMQLELQMYICIETADAVSHCMLI